MPYEVGKYRDCFLCRGEETTGLKWHDLSQGPTSGSHFQAYVPRRCSIRCPSSRGQWGSCVKNILKCRLFPDLLHSSTWQKRWKQISVILHLLTSGRWGSHFQEKSSTFKRGGKIRGRGVCESLVSCLYLCSARMSIHSHEFTHKL